MHELIWKSRSSPLTGSSGLAHPSSSLLRAQPKLQHGGFRDRFEEEADRVAERVVEDPVSSHEKACRCGGACPKCREAQARRAGLESRSPRTSANQGMALPSSAAAVVRSPGRPLDLETRRLMEGRIGHDFSRVRIHADPQASESARAIGARAYTVGRHIAFAPGELAPSTSRGRQLLAHELTHTIQQAASPSLGGSSGSVGNSGGGWLQMSPDDEKKGRAPEKKAKPKRRSSACSNDPARCTYWKQMPDDHPCMGWFKDCTGFAIKLAEFYHRTEHTNRRSKNPGSVKTISCGKGSLGQENAFIVHFDNGDSVGVSMVHVARGGPVVACTAERSCTHRCEYSFVCDKPWNLKFQKLRCRDKR